METTETRGGTTQEKRAALSELAQGLSLRQGEVADVEQQTEAEEGDALAAFGAYLRRRREFDLGLTQEEVVLKTRGELSLSTLQKLERAQTTAPTARTLVLLAEALSVDLSDLVRRANAARPSRPRRSRLGTAAADVTTSTTADLVRGMSKAIARERRSPESIVITVTAKDGPGLVYHLAEKVLLAGLTMTAFAAGIQRTKKHGTKAMITFTLDKSVAERAEQLRDPLERVEGVDTVTISQAVEGLDGPIDAEQVSARLAEWVRLISSADEGTPSNGASSER